MRSTSSKAVPRRRPAVSRAGAVPPVAAADDPAVTAADLVAVDALAAGIAAAEAADLAAVDEIAVGIVAVRVAAAEGPAIEYRQRIVP